MAGVTAFVDHRAIIIVSLVVEHIIPLSCRAMVEADLNTVLAIEAKCHTSPWSYDNFHTSLTSTHTCWVLEKQGSIIAYAITSTVLGEAELLNISVDPTMQKKGIAKAFLLALCHSFTDTVETFFLEVRESNAAAIALYQSLDFNEVGQRPNYYPAKNGREDALIMATILASPF